MRYVPYQTPMYSGTTYQNIPTIGNIGGYGYYNQFYNPYYIRQQEEAQRKVQIQNAKNQADIWIRLGKACDTMNGVCRSDEEMMQEIIEIAKIKNQYDKDEEFMNGIYRITQQAAINKIAEIEAERRMEEERHNYEQQNSEEHKSFYDWLKEDGQEMYDEVNRIKLRQQQHNVSNLYDTNAYNQMLMTHDSVFTSLNRNVTIDDMEIQVNLPERIRMQREERRQKFREALMKGGI